jgi:penicillin-binding protein 2
MFRFFKKRRYKNHDLDPDEIFLDDHNAPGFDLNRLEGSLEQPIDRGAQWAIAGVYVLAASLFLYKTFDFQIINGASYATRATKNTIEEQVIFPERGVVKDRNGVILAWNELDPDDEFARRIYTSDFGFGHILGYTKYPRRDTNGKYITKEYTPMGGVEEVYNKQLTGTLGKRIVEADAKNHEVWSGTQEPANPGEDLVLAIDAEAQKEFYKIIGARVRAGDWKGGAAGAIMDVETGEILSAVSYPDYDPNAFASGSSTQIAKYARDEKNLPMLNRLTGGLYTPGSIVKPIGALGALEEGVITRNTVIESLGRIIIPNPYFPDKPTIFNDWRAHGKMTVREAIAYSSDVFFYEIAGGYKNQKGIGIERLEDWYRKFGYATPTGVDLPNEIGGIIPNPEWKKKKFPGEPWRIGDTYYTGIGQFGIQITPMQALVSAAALANNGVVLRPHLIAGSSTSVIRTVEANPKNFEDIQEGMRMVVTRGTANVLAKDGVRIAAKSGTAELGVSKKRVNSWIIGYFPYEKPKYAFVLMLGSGVKGDPKNASVVFREFVDWMAWKRPQWLGLKEAEGLPSSTSTVTVLEPATGLITSPE